MAYGDFTLELALARLGLTQTTGALFPAAEQVAVPGWLTQLLARNTPVAVSN